MDHKSILDQYRPNFDLYELVYRVFHQKPELSKQECHTARIIAGSLSSFGTFKVHQHIGGHGIVGVLHNGPGPVVLLRAVMDALPQLEQTGLPYASKKTVTDTEGNTTPVMHANGHDMQTVALMGVAKFLHSSRPKWSGTFICLFQPAGELAEGAKAMVDDGLYDPKRHGVPVPTVIIGQHVHAIKTGLVALSGGPILTAVDSFEVRIFGRSGHISRPDLCVNPITTACQIVVRLQGLVTKEVQPEDFAVVACASIHGEAAANIVPEFVDLKISIRSYRLEVQERLVAGVKRVVRAECEASGSLRVREPELKTIMHAPPTINDMEKSTVLKTAFARYFGPRAIDSDPFGASEDFSYLATACGAPYVFYTFGCVDAEVWDEAERKGKLEGIPQNHSAFFAPVIQPTLRTGVDAFALAALTFLDPAVKG
ncbi:MAG: hypothetical protein LQ347_006888 [Umbilicaria vellea]|nr:MAG: hypothetical protein LQ347_006888 [Umbilicaria vellea]